MARSFWYHMNVEIIPVPPGAPANGLTPHTVSPGYFSLVGMRVERGRGFTTEDRMTRPLVAVLGKGRRGSLLARTSPIGKRS